MPDNRRQLLTVLVAVGVVAGGYMVWTAFQSPSRQEQTAEMAEQSPMPDDGEGEGEAEPAGEEREAGDGGERPEGQPRVSPAQRLEQEETFVIETADFKAVLSNLNTGLRSVELKPERWREESGEPKQMVTTDRERYLPMKLELGGVQVPSDAVWEGERLSERVVRFTWEGNGFRVVRKLEVGEGPFQLWSTVRVVNLGETARPVRVNMTTHHWVEREDEEGGFFASRSPAISHGFCLWGGDEEIERIDREDANVAEHGQPAHGFGPGVQLAGIENTYFANVMAVHGEPAGRCQISAKDLGGTLEEPQGSLFETRLIYPRADVAGGGSHQVRTLLYVGPKDPDALAAAGHHLPEVIDLGWFSAVATWLVSLLRLIFGWVGNWGLAIIVMTVMVRIALFPLTWKSFQSMARMRVLKPEMDRINELYKEDREKKGAAMMELYRKHKINPLGGCLPQLLQMPVWFAFYASLSTNVELYHADFILWWTDLSAPDPYYALPLTLGGLMFLQQKITPTAMDPMQAKIMMYFMPIMITTFMLFLPAGLCLYMVTNSVLGIAQQQMIHRKLNKEASEKKESEADEEEEKESATSPDSDGDGRDADVPAAEPVRSSSVVRRTRPKGKSKSRKAAKRRSRRAR